MLHLPLLTANKQMGTVNQTVAKLGLTIRGIYGEGSDALGNLYQVSNQATLGRTENEIIEAVVTVGEKLIEMERVLRQKSDISDPVHLEDQVCRSYGVIKHARRMSQKEFMTHWSNLRLGVSLCRVPLSLESIDCLLECAQDAHVMKWAGTAVTGDSLDETRCQYIRKLLSAKRIGR
jgi:protein arginine kinase